MNDDTKKAGQNSLGDQNKAQSQPFTGSANKEAAPIQNEPVDYLRPSEVEPDAKKLSELGIEAKNQEKVALTDEDRSAGISHAKESTPVATSPSGNIKLPITEAQASENMKTKGNDESGKWLADLVLKVLSAMKLKDSKID